MSNSNLGSSDRELRPRIKFSQVKGSPLRAIIEGICKRCALGKNSKHAYPKSVHKSKSILELIHTDLCGPMSTPSINGCLYYIIFIDDYSRRTWIYFLKQKESSEVLSKFKEFKTLLENQSGKQIKTLRSDNGGEYIYDIFKDFCISIGIKREFSIPYNPQENGVAERKNRSIIESTKAMIHDQNLHISFWGEASNTAVYIQNHCPHSVLDNITPEEVFSRIKPDLSHLHIFGCPVYVYIPKEKRTKLEPSRKKGVFIGYSENSKGYKIYIPGQKTIEISRDVKFEEDTTFNMSKYDDESILEQISDSSESHLVENEREYNSKPPTSNPEETENNNKKRPFWARKSIEETNVEPDEVMKENKRTRTHSCYVALITELNKTEPSNSTDALASQPRKRP